MSDRKYRQRGYMESNRESQQPKPQSKPQSKPQDREGPRSPRMMAFGEMVKCAACGAKVPPNINVDSSCPKCNADLHSCRLCTYFDPAARFECSKSIPARIVNKNARNTCELFSARIVVERETSSGPPTDARQAFAKLFKK
jgi:ubiquitin